MLYDPRLHKPVQIHIDKDGHVSIEDSSEAAGNIFGKIGIAWAGFFAGIELSDLVLLATLIYTCAQTCVLLWEKVIKPMRKSRRAVRTGKPIPETSPAPLNSGD